MTVVTLAILAAVQLIQGVLIARLMRRRPPMFELRGAVMTESLRNELIELAARHAARSAPSPDPRKPLHDA